MDKKIEEMARELREIQPLFYASIAEQLYNAGYRKIPEGAVVISRAEYNDLRGLEKHFDDYLIKEIVETRKETAEKIANRVHNLFNRDIKDSVVYTQEEKTILKEFVESIDEIARK